MGYSVTLKVNSGVLRADGADITGAYMDVTRPGYLHIMNMDTGCPSKGLSEITDGKKNYTSKVWCNAEGKVFTGEAQNLTGPLRKNGWYGMLDAEGICWQDGNCWKLVSAKAEEGITVSTCKAQCGKLLLGKAFDGVYMPQNCSAKCDEVYGLLKPATERAGSVMHVIDRSWSDPDWSAAPKFAMHIIDRKGRMCLQGPADDLEYMKVKLTNRTCNMRARWNESSLKPGACWTRGYNIGSAPPGNTGISMFFTKDIVKDENWHDIAFRAMPDMLECYMGKYFSW
jgi:hypothetical protein